jgi:hypothetical protein
MDGSDTPSEAMKLLTKGLGIGIFQIGAASSDDPLPPGFYWRAPRFRIFRGPFDTREQAEADGRQTGRELIAAIVVSTGGGRS